MMYSLLKLGSQTKSLYLGLQCMLLDRARVHRISACHKQAP